MTTAQLIKTVADAFDNSDNKTILAYLAEDVEWYLLGGPSVVGLENIGKFLDEHKTKIISSTRDNFILDGNKAVINGEVSCLTVNGKTCNMFYCDIYEVKNDKVKKIVSYIIDKK